MNNTLVAFLCGIGISAWVFNKFQKTTGNNTQKSIGGAVVAGILSFITMLVILATVV